MHGCPPAQRQPAQWPPRTFARLASRFRLCDFRQASRDGAMALLRAGVGAKVLSAIQMEHHRAIDESRNRDLPYWSRAVPDRRCSDLYGRLKLACAGAFLGPRGSVRVHYRSRGALARADYWPVQMHGLLSVEHGMRRGSQCLFCHTGAIQINSLLQICKAMAEALCLG
jgi:hypothetical protein